METFKLKLSLKITDIQAREEALQDLERWLKSSGVRVELELTQPGVEDLAGGKAVALLLVCSLLNESLEGPLEQIFHWQEHRPDVPVELCLTGQKDIDDPIREKVKHKPENVHIELREPEHRVRKGKPPATGAAK